MSYSVSARGATREAAAAAIGAQFDAVITQQPIHKADVEMAMHATIANLAQVAEPTESQEYLIECAGSVSWQGALDEMPRITDVYTNLNVRLVTKVTSV